MHGVVMVALLALLLALSAQTDAAELELEVTVPRLQVAEYHRPYVAIWLEDGNNQVLADLAVWYDTALANREGEKWLKDMRLWWRRSGRALTFPVDGVSGATRPVGSHRLHFIPGQGPLPALAEGHYQLRLEAAREVGGREVLTLPFSWPVSEATTVRAQGEHELGQVTLTISP